MKQASGLFLLDYKHHVLYICTTMFKGEVHLFNQQAQMESLINKYGF